MSFDDFEQIDTYTYEELKAHNADFFNSLNADAQHRFITENDCTFEMYVFSKIREGDIVEINSTTYTFRILPKKSIDIDIKDWISKQNLTGTQVHNGVYFHYNEVVTLLELFKSKVESETSSIINKKTSEINPVIKRRNGRQLDLSLIINETDSK